jgi:hypothetical protein
MLFECPSFEVLNFSLRLTKMAKLTFIMNEVIVPFGTQDASSLKFTIETNKKNHILADLTIV